MLRSSITVDTKKTLRLKRRTIQIKMRDDFTDALGARTREQGNSSGQEFYEDLLKPCVERALKDNLKIFIDFDDTWGVPHTFTNYCFCALRDDYGPKIMKRIKIKSKGDKNVQEHIDEIMSEDDYEL